MHRTRARLTSIAIALALAACGSSSDDSAPATAATAAPAAPVEPATSAPPETPMTTEAAAAATTTAPETTTTTTEPAPPPIGQLSVEQLAELPGRFVEAAFTDGSSIVALTRTDTADFEQSAAFVRMDAAGTIVQEAPIDGSTSVFDVIEAGGRYFAYGTFSGAGGPWICGFAEVDALALTFGPVVATTDDGTCGGSAVVDDTAPTVIWTTAFSTASVIRVDTATGVVTPTSLAEVVPAGYELFGVTVLDGHGFVTLGAGYDEVTGDVVTAPDGSALAPMLIRVDGASGATTVAQVAGWPRVVDGRLLVHADGGAVHELDPTTLVGTELTKEDRAGLPRGSATFGDATAWTVEANGGPQVAIAQRDPETLRVLAEGSADSGFSPEAWINVEPLPIGADLYLVAAQQLYDEANGTMTSSTKVYRATGQVAG